MSSIRNSELVGIASEVKFSEMGVLNILKIFPEDTKIISKAFNMSIEKTEKAISGCMANKLKGKEVMYALQYLLSWIDGDIPDKLPSDIVSAVHICMEAAVVWFANCLPVIMNGEYEKQIDTLHCEEETKNRLKSFAESLYKGEARNIS